MKSLLLAWLWCCTGTSAAVLQVGRAGWRDPSALHVAPPLKEKAVQLAAAPTLDLKARQAEGSLAANATGAVKGSLPANATGAVKAVHLRSSPKGLAKGTAGKASATEGWFEGIWLYVIIGIGVALVLIAVAVAVVVVSCVRRAVVPDKSTGDTSCVLAAHFEVAKGKLPEVKAQLEKLQHACQPNAEASLFNGFTVDETSNAIYYRLVCESAVGLRKHAEGDHAVNKVMNDLVMKGCGRIASMELHGQDSALDEVKEVLPDCTLFKFDAGNRMYIEKSARSKGTGSADESILFCSRYEVAADKMDEFKSLFDKFYSKMDPDTEKAIFFGFAVTLTETGGVVVCHKAYDNAEGLQLHLDTMGTSQDADLSPQTAALELSTASSHEVHGPKAQLSKLRTTLSPLKCKFFVSDGSCRTWMTVDRGSDVDLESIDMDALYRKSMARVMEQVSAQADKSSTVRSIVETGAGGFVNKAKDFVVRELNDTCTSVMQAVDEEEAKMMCRFSESVEASFPRVSVLMAGIVAPAALTSEYWAHMIQFALLFFPVLLGTSWAIYEDWGQKCSIPGLVAWIYVTLAVSFLLAMGHGILAFRCHWGRTALAKKSEEVRARIERNAADGSTSMSDVQDMLIGYTILVQEAILLENSIRKSFWKDVIALATVFWLFVASWNFILVIGWTFMPGQIAFHPSAFEAADGDYCGSWASVFIARWVCLWCPVFFLLNLFQVIKWLIQTVLHSFSNRILDWAKEFDNSNTGLPVVQTMLKGVLLRGGPDIVPTKVTIALGEALRLSHEQEDLQDELQDLNNRIGACDKESENLVETGDKLGLDMKANLERLEDANEETVDTWKTMGTKLVAEAEAKAFMAHHVTTSELDRVVSHITELCMAAKDSELVQSALRDGCKEAAEFQKIAAHGISGAQALAGSPRLAGALAHAQEAVETAGQQAVGLQESIGSHSPTAAAAGGLKGKLTSLFGNRG